MYTIKLWVSKPFCKLEFLVQGAIFLEHQREVGLDSIHTGA